MTIPSISRRMDSTRSGKHRKVMKSTEPKSHHMKLRQSLAYQALSEPHLHTGIKKNLPDGRVHSSSKKKQHPKTPSQKPSTKTVVSIETGHAKMQDQENAFSDSPKKKVIDREFDSCKKTHVFALAHQQLNADDVDYLMNRFGQLPEGYKFRKIQLRNCDVDDRLLKKLFESGIEAGKIDFSVNSKLRVSTLNQFLNKAKAKSLDLSDCNLDMQQMTSLGKVKVASLKLNYKAFVGDSAAKPLSQILDGGLKTLELVNSSISPDDLKNLAIGSGIALQYLDLGNVPLDEYDMATVGKLVNRTSGMKRLGLSECDITTEGLREFHEVTSKQIHELDVSYNEEIDEDGDRVLALIVVKCQTMILDISERSLTGANIRALREANCEVPEVNLSENPGIDPSELGKLVVGWKIKKLDISECRLEAQDLTEFCNNIGTHELQRLNLNDPTDVVSKDKWQALRALSKKVTTLVFGNHQIWT